MMTNITAEEELIKTGKVIVAVLFLLNVSALFSQTTITAKLSDEKIGVGEVFSLFERNIANKKYDIKRGDF